MSSQRRPGGRQAGPPPERKAPAGPVLTPQVLMVIYFVLLAAAGVAYWQMVVKSNQEAQAAATARIQTADANIATYKKKGEKLEIAEHLNVTVKKKLKDTAYMFLTDQSSVIPFWEETFFPILFSSNLGASDKTKLKSDKYTFQINMAMNPFGTLPPSNLFDDEAGVFQVHYEPEQGGVPVEEPLATMKPDFLFPYNIKMEHFVGTYEDVQRFIRHLQLRQNKTLFTVHCFKNSEDANQYGFRTQSEWDISLTVYFINPEANANGDTPPGLPGANSC